MGNKNIEGVYHKIINQIPPHKRYIELFLGSGAILKNKLPASDQSIGVEIDPETIKEFNWDKFNYHRLSILNQDAIQFLRITALQNGIEWQKETFIYLDPPYPLSSRKKQTHIYRHSMTDAQHITLLKILLKLKCKIAISSYPNSIYDKYLKDWRVIKFKVQTRNGIQTEALYMNYNEPSQLHDYRYLGKNITERQMIKRKISRHVSRLKKLPALERAAIINEIINANPELFLTIGSH